MKTSSNVSTPTTPVSLPPLGTFLSQGLASQSVHLCVFDVPMLPPVNEKTRKTATTVYTSAEYRAREREVALAISAQVRASTWSVSKEDRYLVEFHFPFEHELLRDLDGSLKPVLDSLQQMEPTLAELRQMHDPEKLAAWQSLQPVTYTKTGRVKTVRPTTYRQWKKLVNDRLYAAWLQAHPPAIRNDSQVVDIEVVKYTKQQEGTPARLYLYRLSATRWQEIKPFYYSQLHQARAALLAGVALFPTC